MGSGRNYGKRQYFHAVTTTLDPAGTARVTVEIPECELFRVSISGIAAGATARYRGIHEMQAGGLDPVDSLAGTAISAAFSAPLDEANADSGWIPAQPTAIRVVALVGVLTVTVHWVSHVPPQVA